MLWSKYKSLRRIIQCEYCCRDCCYSTPFITLGAICYISLCLLGFTISSIIATAKLNTIPHLENGTVVMAPVVGGAVVSTILPVVVATILGYCITGYIRDVLFHSTVKRCIGPSCNTLWMLLTFLYALLWVILVAGFAGITFYYIEAKLVCDEFENSSDTGFDNPDNCFHYVDKEFQYYPICGGDGLKELCNDGLQVGLAYAVSLIFAFLIVIGLIILLVIQTANFITVKDNLEYRHGASYNREDGFHLKHR